MAISKKTREISHQATLVLVLFIRVIAINAVANCSMTDNIRAIFSDMIGCVSFHPKSKDKENSLFHLGSSAFLAPSTF